MTTVKNEPVVEVRRPGPVVALIVLLVFLGITALAVASPWSLALAARRWSTVARRHPADRQLAAPWAGAGVGLGSARSSSPTGSIAGLRGNGSVRSRAGPATTGRGRRHSQWALARSCGSCSSWCSCPRRRGCRRCMAVGVQLALAAAPALGAPLPCFTYGTFGRTQGSAGPHDEGRHRHHAGNGNRRAHHR